MSFCSLLTLTSALIWIHSTNAISSPISPLMTYQYATEIESGVADLWWNVDQTKQDITFELHMKTNGWIALGISPAGGMKGADIGLGWIDAEGKLHFEDRYATGTSQPLVDTTTIDWFGLQGREQNGWTAIQFRRALDTCDSMDVPIKSGTNILIFAYGLEDPIMSNGKATISYHGNRRITRMIPLQSYGNPPAESKFAGLDYFEFKLNKYAVPANETTYHCKVYKAPTNFRERRQAIAHKTMIDSANRDIVHHLLMYECNPTATFDDNKLPDGPCDDIYYLLSECSSNIATGWAVGGDDVVEFPEIAGYPVGGDFEIKYYMVQMHYDNPHQMSNRTDSSGIRFYLGAQPREHELGYLTLGADSSILGIVLPPRTDHFIVDSYCSAIATAKFPSDGITVVSAFPHTHLQGRTVWTKIIRNGTAVEYLFNGEAYDFNYQFENRLPEPIKLYPGDELATRCIYSTTNKDTITLGGEATRDEMCLHMFTYYPRMKDMYGCIMFSPMEEWQTLLNVNGTIDYPTLKKLFQEKIWTNGDAEKWQKFYDTSPRTLIYGVAGNHTFERVSKLPEYKDFDPPQCHAGIINDARTTTNHFSFLIFLSSLARFLIK